MHVGLIPMGNRTLLFITSYVRVLILFLCFYQFLSPMCQEPRERHPCTSGILGTVTNQPHVVHTRWTNAPATLGSSETQLSVYLCCFVTNQKFASSALNALLPFLHWGKRIFAARIRHWQSSIYSVTASPGTPPAKAYTSSRNIIGIRGLHHCSSIHSDLYHKSNKLQKPSCSVFRSSYLIVSCQRTATFH